MNVKEQNFEKLWSSLEERTELYIGKAAVFPEELILDYFSKQTDETYTFGYIVWSLDSKPLRYRKEKLSIEEAKKSLKDVIDKIGDQEIAEGCNWYY
jgi:hypothetical protein